jgi:regulatory protein
MRRVAEPNPNPAECYARALDTLARAARSRADLARSLRRRFTPEAVEETVDRLTANGLLDDRAFARAFAQSRLTGARALGPRRLTAELTRRGIARSVIDETLGALRDEGAIDEEAAARAIAERKAPSLRKLDRQVARRRLHGLLVRRGFSGGAIRNAMEAL